MSDFSRPLGDSVRKAREDGGLTQRALADLLDKDQRTILNIENYHGNPKMEVLYPLIRALKIDPSVIFYPEAKQSTPAKSKLLLEVADCSESEAAALLAVCHTVLTTLRAKDGTPVKE